MQLMQKRRIEGEREEEEDEGGREDEGIEGERDEEGMPLQPGPNPRPNGR